MQSVGKLVDKTERNLVDELVCWWDADLADMKDTEVAVQLVPE